MLRFICSDPLYVTHVHTPAIYVDPDLRCYVDLRVYALHLRDFSTHTCSTFTVVTHCDSFRSPDVTHLLFHPHIVPTRYHYTAGPHLHYHTPFVTTAFPPALSTLHSLFVYGADLHARYDFVDLRWVPGDTGGVGTFRVPHTADSFHAMLVIYLRCSPLPSLLTFSLTWLRSGFDAVWSRTG